MAGFMKNVMSYVGMADVPEDDDYACLLYTSDAADE